MKGILIVFVIIRIILWFVKGDSKKNKTKKTVSKKTQSLDDILGDFMKNIENKKEPKTQTVLSKKLHTAEDDSHKKIEWQDVDHTQIKQKKQLLKHSDYKNISHHNKNVLKVEELEDPDDILNDLDLTEIDLKKAVIYKEILERKYFSV